MSAELEGAFPGLAADGYRLASPKTHSYNCVAWAAGDASRWRGARDLLARTTGRRPRRADAPLCGPRLHALRRIPRTSLP